MTVVLVTETSDLAADLLIRELRSARVSAFRLNQDEFPSGVRVCWRPDRGIEALSTTSRSVSGSSVTGVWYRRPTRCFGLEDLAAEAREFGSREALATVLGLASATPGMWMNPPLAVQTAENKLDQLCAASTSGLDVPGTVVSNHERALSHPPAHGDDVVLKSVSGGAATFDGATYGLYARPLVERPTAQEVRLCPSQFQERIESEFHLRVIVVDDETFVARLDPGRAPAHLDWRAVDDRTIQYSRSALPRDVEAGLRAMLSHYGLRYCSTDFVVDRDGRHWFLDLNPAGQWGWIEARLGLPVTKAIVSGLARRP